MTVGDMRLTLEGASEVEIVEVRDDAIDFRTETDSVKLKVLGLLDRDMVTETRLTYNSSEDVWTVKVV